ncbi:hypothetical protein GR183_19965 [Stappia sp. GBMRC 2046]|uniref:D-3-phosphoglycerate dehydrogenase n=1 Tax=Stappia sediminis TaxID=2692190 RepID=A0A7X3LY19_9HYPH|nr:phosphoglycerate dehydrogenase [Stappia sediminis]MXN67192.1 hypothetical protein [Stappia sediminis]
MSKVLVTCGHLIRHFARFASVFEAHGVSVTIPEIKGQQLAAEEMLVAIRGHSVVIAGDDFIDRATLEAGKADGLKAVVKWGIGTDSIDKAAAKELGIPVYNTPGVFSDEVADLAMGYVIALARDFLRIHESVKAGGWLKVEGTTLSGKTAGVIGLGGIGRAVCRRLNACGMRVIGSDPAKIGDDDMQDACATQVSLPELLERSHFIVVTCALTESSHHLLNADAFGAMKEGVRLVNVARGPIIDEAALVPALRSGRVSSAALDVFEDEPLSPGNPLREFENVIFGSHNGSNTADAVHKVNSLTVNLALDILGLSGQTPRIEPLVS